MDSSELKDLLASLKKLDDAAAAPKPVRSTESAEIYSVLKRLRPVNEAPPPIEPPPPIATESSEPETDAEVLERLSKDPGFLEALSAMKTRQDEIEIRLLDHRNKIKQSYDKQLRECGITPEDTKRRQELVTQMQKELKRYDVEALARWDALAQREQTSRLAELSVPGFSADPPGIPSELNTAEVVRRLCDMLD